VPVFLVRHAHAVDERRDLPDPARHLSEKGRDAARALGQRLRWYDCIPTALWTSPLTRAVQTAELVAAAIDWTGPIESLPALAPDGKARAVMDALHERGHDAVVLLFGHEPNLSALGARLTEDPAFASLAKAQAVRIDGRLMRWRFKYDDPAPVVTANKISDGA
jgi:phosphohistidine phosphatase